MSFLRKIRKIVAYHTKFDTDFKTLLEDTTEGMSTLGKFLKPNRCIFSEIKTRIISKWRTEFPQSELQDMVK